MNIINTGTSSILISTRGFTSSVIVDIVEEETGMTQSFSTSLTQEENYERLDLTSMTYSYTYTYNIDVFNGDENIYKGRIYATDQSDLPNYNMSKNAYREGNSQINEKIKYKFYGQ